MSAVRHYHPHYTHADYLQWPGQWELWFGTAVSMTPSPFAPHERMVSELAYQLQAGIKKHACSCSLYTGLDWIVHDDTVVRPDIMVVCGEQPSDYLRKPPSLIIEVLSRSTAEKDLGPKRELYQQQLVEHYVVVDPEQPSPTWFRRNDLLDYQIQPIAAQTKFVLLDGCELEICWPSAHINTDA